MSDGYERQRGQALVTSMVLILLMATLTAGGFRSALFESRIVDSYWQQQSAFEQAEGAMSLAQSTLITVHLSAIEQRLASAPPTIYPTPDPGPYPGHDPEDATPLPVVSLNVLRNEGSLVVGDGEDSRSHNRIWTMADVTAFNRYGQPTVQLKGYFEHGAVSR